MFIFYQFIVFRVAEELSLSVVLGMQSWNQTCAFKVEEKLHIQQPTILIHCEYK